MLGLGLLRQQRQRRRRCLRSFPPSPHLLNLLLLGLESKGTHGDLELLGVDGSTSIGIEEVESLPDLLLLLLGELELLALASGLSTGTRVCLRAGRGRRA